MNWLITGGSGLIGRSIADAINTDDTVVILDIKEKPDKVAVKENTIWVQGDITNKNQLEEIIKKYKIEGIVHLVSLLRNDCAKNPDTCVRLNVGGFHNLLEISSKLKLSKVIFISSVQVYGSESYYGVNTWVDETTERKPQTLYGITKCHCEDLAEYYKNNLGVNVVGLRFSTIFGYGRASGPNTYLTDCITQAANHQDITIPYKDLKQNLLYVKEASAAILNCMNDKVYKSTIYNICNDKLISNVDIANTLKKIVPDIKVSLTGGEFPMQGATPCTSPLAAKKDSVYDLQYSLEESIVDFMKEVEKNRK